MKTNTLIRIVYLLCLVSLASCVAPGNPAVREARGKFNSRRTIAQGTIGGALLGAAIGAAIGATQGNGDRNDIARGAAFGALAGGVAGNVYGRNVAQQRQAYAVREGALDNAIANASSTRKAASEFNHALAGQLKKARADKSTTAGTVADAQAVLSSVNREIARQRSALDSARTAGLSTRDQHRLQTEISGLEGERRQLQSNIDRLAAPASPAGLAGAR
ncbi:MAG: hypothetical protein JNN17_03460 [Verrucomicrobiaceae bacterium]|nr:hypothetical protein [Verrucomicrobiaceae bacterium]